MKHCFSFALVVGVLSGSPLLGQSPDGDEAPAATEKAPADEKTPTPAAPTAAEKAAGAPVKAVPGPTTTPPVAPLPPPVAAVVLPDCESYLATPLDGSVIQVDKKFYLVSPKLLSDASPATNYLVEVDVETKKAKRLAGFKGGKSASLIGHGKPINAVSIMDFGNGKPDCGEGKTAATALRWADQKVLPSYPIGNYAYVLGESGGRLADLDKGTVLDVDLGTLQKRSVVAFPAGTRPLYVKATPPLAVYTYSPKSRELVKYINNEKKANATLRLKEGMKLVQQGAKFGIVQVQEDDATLQFSQIKDWSGTEMKSFEVKLPAGVKGSSLTTVMSFEGSQFLLYGKDDRARKAMKQVLFYSGKDLTKTFDAPAGTYFSSAHFGSERGIYLVVSDLNTNVVREFWWVDSGADIVKVDVLKDREKSKAK